ncbi:hypothetical protein ANCCAN_14371 [Ancylostoma caninum]|uniref:ISXO2-like transposase domain-containing protein n=1 Tax=Ancylostoma caninum TaxID=29170 RepID=A0A368G5K5_ANCCA|nr:hypothetical protein ANCCAN_14371 [Ancylostoma caninum]
MWAASFVGGIQEGTKHAFVEVTDDRSAANLEVIIHRHATPGGAIRADMWRGYSNRTNLGHIHETVNHSVNFVDPVTGVNTQRIENTWSHLKAKIRSRHRLKGELWDDHFHVVLWKWQFNSENLLYELWRQIAAKYPLS